MLVSLDLCFIPASLYDEVIKAAKLPSDIHILISATHTHSGSDPLCMHSGNYLVHKGWSSFDSELLKFTADQTALAIRRSLDALIPVTLKFVQFAPQTTNPLVKNRRGEKTIDPEVTVMQLIRKAGVVATLINFAAHPVIYGDKNLQFSADWPGVMCEDIEKKYGGTALFFNGAEGDATPIESKGTEEEKVREFGHRASALIIDHLKSMNQMSTVKLEAVSKQITLPPRKVSGLFLAAAFQLGLTLEDAKKLLNSMMPEKTRISFVTIGTITIVGLPCEPTADIGLAIKSLIRKAGYQYPMIFALTNDWLAYAVTKEQSKKGGYEAGMSFYGDALGDSFIKAVATKFKR